MSQGSNTARAIMVAFFLALTPSILLAGSPNAPAAVTTSGLAHSPDAAIDGIGTLMLSYIDQGQVVFTSSTSQFQASQVLTAPPDAPVGPRIAAGGILSVGITFEQPGAAPGAMGNDILLATSSGGGFNGPNNFTFDTVPDTNPAISRTNSGTVHVAYQANPMGTDAEIHSNLPGTGTLVALGMNPSLTEVPGNTYLAYERNGDIIVRSHDGVAFSAEETITGVVAPSTGVELAGTGSGVVHAIFVNSGSLYYTNNSGGTFSAAQQVDAGPINGLPCISSNFAGDVAIAYVVSGQVLVRELNTGVFGPSAVYSGASTTATNPALAVDNNGLVRVFYEDGGNIFRANNVPPPVVDFTASVTSGEILLPVSFTSLATGFIDQWSWDFGDGSSSTSVSPSHTYSEVGSYEVSLTVIGPGGAATLSIPDYITTQPPTNILSMPDLNVTAPSTVLHPITISHPGAVQGFQVIAQFNNVFLNAIDVTITGTFTEAAVPEFLETNFVIGTDPAESYIAIVTIFDVQMPFLSQTIPPGNVQTIGYFEYSVPIGIGPGFTTDITFVDGQFPDGPAPPLNNVIAVDGASLPPFLDHSTVTVVVPSQTFVRGDANQNGTIDLSDTVFILTFLFAGGTAPPCPDAADPNDTGAIDIADAVYLLAYLFSNGSYPRYPFPIPALDPTADTLGPCL